MLKAISDFVIPVQSFQTKVEGYCASVAMPISLSAALGGYGDTPQITQQIELAKTLGRFDYMATGKNERAQTSY